MHNKFQVCYFSRSGDIQGVPKFKSRSRRPRPFRPVVVHYYVTFHLLLLSFVMIALSVVKIYTKTLSVGLLEELLPKQGFWGINTGKLKKN